MEVRSVEAIVRTLNTAEVQYLIVGGLAVNAHGFVRLTRDIDIVLQLDSANVRRGFERFVGNQLSDGDSGDAGRVRKPGKERGLASQQRDDHSETLER
jgi:hypothetical protein